MAHAVVAHVISPWDLLAVVVLATIGLLYAVGRRRMARRATPPRVEQWVFWSGWTVMLAAVLPPIDWLALERFSAHMLQHELLMLVGVPLMIAGRPLAACVWGVPAAVRPLLTSGLQSAALGGAWRALTSPVAAWALHGAVVWAWHVPRLYELAVRHEAVHAVQHAMFVGTSALFWWGLVYGRYGRAGYGASVFYVFTTAVHTGILGAVFTLNPEPLYAVYAERAPDPLADQQLAGLVMWVPAGLILTLTGLGLFAAWLGEAERRSGVALGSARHGGDAPRRAAGGNSHDHGQ
jgi:putative membrane protein